ncbi:hypothetical protein DL95DRAFT_402239 [Leptodontidium sp. 2 PMI_412]|nr:hypothetical protein DL95DRAFT_402239 [Leptodontidium sp. 2 PMI_412]
MASLVLSLITPSDPDATQWQDANQQRLAAIELQREKLRDLERRARLREIETTTSRLESRTERAEDLELRARRHKHHVLLRARESSSRKRIEQRRVSERLELARMEKTSVDDRRKETSLDGDATVARNWEVWRSEQKPRRLHLQKQLSQIGSSIHVIMTPFRYQPSYPAKLKSVLWCLTKAPASSHVLNDILQAESFPTLITIFLEPREVEMRRFGLRAFKWPFLGKDIDKRLQVINDYKATFTLALTSDNFVLTRAIKDDISRIGDSLSDIQIEQRILAISEKQQKLYGIPGCGKSVL